MKRILIVLGCTLLFNNIAYSQDININVKTEIYSVPNDERYLEIKNQKMLKAVAERQWVTQNEGSFCPNYDKIEKELIGKGQYKTAISVLEKNKNNTYCNRGQANRLLGYAYYKIDDFTNSIKNYNLFLNSSSVINPLVYYERGLSRLKVGDYLGAKEDYNIAIKNRLPLDDKLISGEKTFDYTKQGQQYTNNSDIQINDFFVMPISKDTANLILLGQRVPKKQGKISDKDYWQNIIKSKNKYVLAESYNNYAACLIKEGEFQKAKEQLEIAKKINPNLKEIYYNLALISYLDKNYSKALELIEEYFRHDDYQDIKDNFIKEFLSDEEYNKSLDNNFKKEQNYNANILLIYCYLLQDKTEKVTVLNKNFSNSYIKSYLFANNKQYNKSIKELKSILRIIKLSTFAGDESALSTDYWDENVIYTDLALIEVLKQDYEKALKDTQKAKQNSFKNNNIDLYIKNIQIENYILAKLNKF